MRWLWPVLPVALAGCLGAGIGANPYPDREVLRFPSAKFDDTFRYACAASDPTDDIRARGLRAHRAFEAELVSFSDVRTKVLIKGLESGRSPRAITRSLDAQTEIWAQTTADRIDAKYHCIPLSGS